MESKEEQSERRRRMVKCNKHGLHYDPKMASGCTLCLKESTKAPPGRPPQVTIILLCLLGMAFAVYQIFGPDQPSEEEAFLGPAPEPFDGEQPPPLDPEPYRQPIEALERELFSESTSDRDLAGVRLSIVYATRNLGAEVRRQAPGYARSDADAIEALGSGIADAFTFSDLENLKSRWLRLRDRVFETAPWFNTPDLGTNRAVRVIVAEYASLAGNLQALIEEGAAEAQSYVDSEEFPDRDQRWQDFQADWRERLGALWQYKPARPSADAAPEVLAAILQLETAFETTWGLSSGSGYLQSDNPTLFFDPALKQVEDARRALDEARP